MQLLVPAWQVVFTHQLARASSAGPAAVPAHLGRRAHARRGVHWAAAFSGRGAHQAQGLLGGGVQRAGRAPGTGPAGRRRSAGGARTRHRACWAAAFSGAGARTRHRACWAAAFSGRGAHQAQGLLGSGVKRGWGAHRAGAFSRRSWALAGGKRQGAVRRWAWPGRQAVGSKRQALRATRDRPAQHSHRPGTGATGTTETSR